MISADDLKKNEDSAALVIANSKDFDVLTWDAARAITELCDSVRELQKQLQDCRDLRDGWCSEFTKVRDAAKAMIEVDDRDALTDPDQAATDEYRAEVWANLRAAVSHN